MWRVEFLSDSVRAELDGFPADVRACFERIVSLIGTFGLERVHEPYIKHIEGRLWKMRSKGKDSLARALYVTASDRRIVVLRVFAKKTRKTPRREIAMALSRASTVK